MSAEPERMVDISHHEGNYRTGTPPTWANLDVELVRRVCLKATEKRKIDETFVYNAGECRRLEYALGGYHFWHPTDGLAEAQVFSGTVRGWGMDFLALDFEPDLRMYSRPIPNAEMLIHDQLKRIEDLMLTWITGIRMDLWVSRPILGLEWWCV